jgi:hypothetical protein
MPLAEEFLAVEVGSFRAAAVADDVDFCSEMRYWEFKRL